MENNGQKLQAILYAHGGEMKKKEVAELLDVSLSDITQYSQALETLLTEQGLELLETDSTLSLRTSREYADFVMSLHEKENQKDIGTAGLEVLSIVLYKGKVSRSVIDYIRGVNSSGTLRQLVLRGLLERSRDEEDARAWVYTATPELFAFLGIADVSELPEYETITDTLTQHMEAINKMDHVTE